MIARSCLVNCMLMAFWSLTTAVSANEQVYHHTFAPLDSETNIDLVDKRIDTIHFGPDLIENVFVGRKPDAGFSKHAGKISDFKILCGAKLKNTWLTPHSRKFKKNTIGASLQLGMEE